jgi:hypothetical protein
VTGLRGRLRRVWAPPVGVALLLTGCAVLAGGSEAERAVSETGERLADITSGTVEIRVLTGGLDDAGADVGFELEGPFDVVADPPVARFTYTQFVADTEQTSVLTTVDGASFIEVDDVAYRLDEDGSRGVRIDGPLEGLDLSAWVLEPTLSEHGGGVDRIEGRLDAPVAIRDLMTLSAGDTATGPHTAFAEADADQIRSAVRSSTVVLETGSENRLLHRIHGVVEFARDPDTGVRIPGGRFEFTIAISDHNEPIDVSAPADPRPIGEMPEPATER